MPNLDRATLVDALDATTAIGPYFAVTTDPVGPAWRPFAELLTDAGVGERVDVVAAALAERVGEPVERRTCASTHHLALASRLMAPVLATVAVDGVAPGLDAGRLAWQPVIGGPVPLAIDPVDGRRVGDAGDAARALLADAWPVQAELVEAFARAERVSTSVLWGNVASVTNSAADLLVRSGVRSRIDPVAVARALVGEGGLRPLGRYERPGRAFVRDSCCLFYRVPGGGKCGDCVLL